MSIPYRKSDDINKFTMEMDTLLIGFKLFVEYTYSYIVVLAWVMFSQKGGKILFNLNF